MVGPGIIAQKYKSLFRNKRKYNRGRFYIGDNKSNDDENS